MPGLAGQRRQQQTAAHQRNAGQHHRARPGAVHQTSDQGLTTADATKPNEKAPAVTPRSQPNSVRIGG